MIRVQEYNKEQAKHFRQYIPYMSCIHCNYVTVYTMSQQMKYFVFYVLTHIANYKKECYGSIPLYCSFGNNRLYQIRGFALKNTFLIVPGI